MKATAATITPAPSAVVAAIRSPKRTPAPNGGGTVSTITRIAGYVEPLTPIVSSVIVYDDFDKVDMRVGRIVAVDEFPQARKPAWKLTIDFGEELGTRRSSAQIVHYAASELEGRLVVAVVNLAPRQVGPFISDVLVLGAIDAELGVVLLAPDADAALGSRIG
jgi:tRNA-binding protein